LTSALSATERRRISAVLTACPSCSVSRPIEIVRIKTMIEPPIASPVRMEMMPATSRISDSGSSSRRSTARSGPIVLAGASLLGP
jgi:anti-sigma factor RsiW